MAKRKKGGRPSSFKPEYVEQSVKLARLGAIDADLADFFGVSETTINNWKNAHPEFLEALKKGKAQADAEVADKLFQRATGYEHEAVKIFQYEGQIIEAPYIKRYAPDTTAAIFWLKNRRPDRWRDKQDIEHSGKVDGGVLAIPGAIDPETWADVAAKQQRDLAKHREAGE